MGESERFCAHRVGDPEERTGCAVVLPFRSSSGVNKTPIYDEAMAEGSRMLSMISTLFILDTISVFPPAVL